MTPSSLLRSLALLLPLSSVHGFTSRSRLSARPRWSSTRARASTVSMEYDYDVIIVGCGVGGHGAGVCNSLICDAWPSHWSPHLAPLHPHPKRTPFLSPSLKSSSASCAQPGPQNVRVCRRRCRRNVREPRVRAVQGAAGGFRPRARNVGRRPPQVDGRDGHGGHFRPPGHC